jgi:hypothetical protein
MTEGADSSPDESPVTPRRRWTAWRVVMPVAVLLCGGLFAVSALNSGGADLRPGRYTDLAALVRTESRQYDALRDQVAQLTDEVAALAATVDNDRVERLRADARLNHNLETVERLHPWARPGGRYWRSISLLGAAKRMDPARLTKSGIILGLGEAADEIRQALSDLRKASVDIVTLGQYLRPSEHHAPVARWVTPGEFAEWKRIGEAELGFRHVESGPLVRSSYHAETQARTVQAGGPGEISEILEADVPAPAETRSSPAGGLVQIESRRSAAAG